MRSINGISSIRFMEICNPKISVGKKAMQWTYNHEKKSNNTNKGRLFLKNKYFNTQFHKVFLVSMKNTEMQWELDILRFHIFLPEIYFL